MRLQLGLTADQKAERRKGIGGSDAKVIMEGDPAALIQLWKEKRGEAEPEDLSRVLPVQLGSFTEPFNVHWYELMTGRTVTSEGKRLQNPDYPFAWVTLDGLTTNAAGHVAVFQAKHVNQFSKVEEIAQRYQPQVHHEMFVCGLSHAVLSVLIGTMGYEAVEIERDDWYLAQLIDREREFWRCVTTGEPPAAMPVVAPPVQPAKFRTVDMTGSNLWASLANDWLSNCGAAKTFEKAAKELRGLVEPDVGLATGHGITVSRSKSGALTIKETKAAKEAA